MRCNPTTGVIFFYGLPTIASLCIIVSLKQEKTCLDVIKILITVKVVTGCSERL